jgi:hypothetical protein
MGRGQFLAAANALCSRTSAAFPYVSDLTDLPSIAAAARAALAVYPGYLKQARALAANQSDHTDLEASWIAPEQTDYDAVLSPTQQFLAAMQRGDTTTAGAALGEIFAAPDHRNAVESYLDGIGLTECSALEAK